MGEVEFDVMNEDALTFTLKDKNDRACQEIMSELRTKYSGKINAQRNKINKEVKFADSMDGDRPTATAKQAVEAFKERIDESELVAVRIDRKTVILVAKHKCMQDENGQWVKKQDRNVLIKQ